MSQQKEYMPDKTESATVKCPYVGVVIVCWNNETILAKCLDSVKAQKYKNIKTIVLDNNSLDKSVELIETKYPWVKLIKSPNNVGFSKGNNLVINKFMGDSNIKYFALLNSDASIDPYWVENLVKFAEGIDNVACMQGVTLDYYDNKVIDSTHIYINRQGQAIQGGYRLGLDETKLIVTKVFGVNAAACMITRKFLTDQPFDYLFDEDFFMYLEDVDVAARSVNLGWDNYFIPDAVAYHMGSVSSNKNPGFSVYMVNRYILPTLFKNLPVSIIVIVIPRMILADSREIYRILKGRNYAIFKKFITGRIKGVSILPQYLNKRITLFRLRKTTNRKLWALMHNGTEEH